MNNFASVWPRLLRLAAAGGWRGRWLAERIPVCAQNRGDAYSRDSIGPDAERDGDAGNTPTAEVGAPAEIANISSIVRQPNSHMVEVRYNQVVPRRIEGSLDDPAIRQLLMLASENSASARVRDDSVGCWRPSAGPGTVARRRAFAMRC